MPQGTPRTTSGTYTQALGFTNAECLFEAYSRIGLRGTALEQQHMTDGRRSIQLALLAWSNKGVNLFQLEQKVIQLEEGKATYLMPPEVVSITDAYYNTIQSLGVGSDFDSPSYDPSQPMVTADPAVTIAQSTDRWLLPMDHAEYARFSNKYQLGQISRYWFNRVGPPAPTTITFYQPPSQGWPQAAVTYFAVRLPQDANLANGEIPDVVTRFLDALIAETARRVARKYAPQLIGTRGSGGLLDDAEEAWLLASAEDTNKNQAYIRPDLFRYFQM